MRLIGIDVTQRDAELVADRCWQAGAAGIWELDDALRVGVEDEAVDGFLAAVADLDPADVTDVEAVELAGREVTVEICGREVMLWVPPTVFGDGSHPTTTTCLRLLDGLVTPGEGVLDVGCGAGALSISAALQGGIVTAIDIDPVAVHATADNAVRNDVAVGASTTSLGEISTSFDVVVANMTSGALAPLVPSLVAHCRPGSALLLSGMLEDQWPSVRDAAAGHLEHVALVDGWLTGLLRAP